jgi:hypothetical protein
MKSLILLATLVTTSAFAGFGHSTYTYHDFGAALRGIELSNACITATEVKTINAMNICTKYETKTVHAPHNETYEETNCVEHAMQNLAFPRTFTKTICVKMTEGRHYSGCEVYGTEEAFLPDTIKVATVTVNGDRENWPGVSANFSFPACK